MPAGQSIHPSMDASVTKVMSVRLPVNLAAELDVVARADGGSISEAIRAAIYRHVATRRGDERFQARLRDRVEKDHQIVERLAR
jgi:metal-responsive CopG/Arc/MetJ family transcriptional regulator